MVIYSRKGLFPAISINKDVTVISNCSPPMCVYTHTYIHTHTHTHTHMFFPGSSDNLESIPGSGRSPGEWNGYPLQYSCQENSIDRGAGQTTVHGVIKSQTQLSN